MTTLRQAAEQALNALERGETKLRYAAITALKTALAEPEEPVAWQWLDTAHFRKQIPADATPSDWRPLYTTPPQRPAEPEERNFCPRCGKRTHDIHTCTPPQLRRSKQ